MPTTNPAKTIFGAAYDVEFGNISTAIATKYDSTTTSITLTGTLTAGTLVITGSSGLTVSPTFEVSATAGNAALLYIAGNGNSPGSSLLLQQDNTNTAYIRNLAGTLYVGAGGANAISINTSGNVTISAPSSGTAFTVNGSSVAIGDTNAIQILNSAQTSSVRLTTVKGWTGAGSDVADFVLGSSGALGIYANNSNNASLQIDSSGNVNIPVASGSTTLGPIYSGIPVNQQTVNYTLVLADANKCVYGAGTTNNITIPANTSVAFPVGTAITFVNRATNPMSISITTDSLLLANSASSGTRTLTASVGVATAIKIASTIWVISGSGLS